MAPPPSSPSSDPVSAAGAAPAAAMASSGPLSPAETAAFVATLLREDGIDPATGRGDVTTDLAVPAAARAAASAVARETMVVAGLGLALAVFRALDPTLEIAARVRDGERLAAGETLFTVAGAARPILVGERAALNLLQHLSGIATLTRAYADAIDGTGTVLLDTRKTVPGLRRLAKYASRCGGAHNHRQGLADAILIKDNHIAAAGGVQAALDRVMAKTDLPIELECDNLDQVKTGLASGVSRLLLDNMDLSTMREAVSLAAGHVPLEASGGVTLTKIRSIAETGVDFVSVGRLTQSAHAIDIGLDFACSRD
ncbi:nicotinate-nucleotide pyrophosphorylase [carboxylating] [Rhodothalassium salexigens DSM 2132]|uniref:Probable nicotinate-nucleotide pyrophosphorylase [carboxylating] n=2 Tax=Rhodothalassium salexigens TaxID=1086 RepID=A0A4R2PIH1_RHOSA|nr:carboxylating nicotinate-nucleotide diphosphorylase [Rhodothalassium salexigens]MBB4211361.1 nicotinate-nucleotide pyrophosphorylase (carboxylating) [Rhodothalassium salexigens DSM 2132]TCP35282.1 nicotinate-nucleotide pyrophosphorylase [carboxylating] [Rhodothalassium salexigens DSM 2132]